MRLVRREARGPRRRGLTAFTLGSFAVGLVLMIPFEHAVTLALGVLAMVAFIVAGVFLIADPAFLAEDDEP